MARIFRTRFQVCVNRLGVHRQECGVSTGKDSLAEAMAVAFEYATFYCGARGARVTVEEVCDACSGSGVVQCGGRRRFKQKRCPACRGNAIVQTIAFQAKPHSDCSLFRYDEQLFPQTLATGTGAS